MAVQRKRLGEVGNRIETIEDQVLCVGVLSLFTVYLASDIEIVWIADLIRCDDGWTKWSVCIKRLANLERLRTHLPVTHADIIAAAVTGDDFVRAFMRHMLAVFADDNDEFCLVVQL